MSIVSAGVSGGPAAPAEIFLRPGTPPERLPDSGEPSVLRGRCHSAHLGLDVRLENVAQSELVRLPAHDCGADAPDLLLDHGRACPIMVNVTHTVLRTCPHLRS